MNEEFIFNLRTEMYTDEESVIKLVELISKESSFLEELIKFADGDPNISRMVQFVTELYHKHVIIYTVIARARFIKLNNSENSLMSIFNNLQDEFSHKTAISAFYDENSMLIKHFVIDYMALGYIQMIKSKSFRNCFSCIISEAEIMPQQFPFEINYGVDYYLSQKEKWSVPETN
ncbi:MAG TPA: hypothetical protein DCW90_03975 [Lachnospiraceae bacterium]|nr:hypothetical protein [Lachnospiraceae bacterium]